MKSTGTKAYRFLQQFVLAFIIAVNFLGTPILVDCASAQTVPNTEPRLIGKKWADINFGPSTTLSLQVSKDNIAYKGIAIRLDEGVGGVSSGIEFMVFDTDTLRWAGGWTGEGFIDWRGIALNGEHEIHPSIKGDLLFTNPVAPGWAKYTDGSFEDVRAVGRDGLRYGPLPRPWAHWKGHYIHGDNVILSYTVGVTPVLEMPSAEGVSGARVQSRTFNIGSSPHDLQVRIADSQTKVSIKDGIATFKTVESDTNTYASVSGIPGNASFATALDGKALVLNIPKGNPTIRIKVLIGSAENAEAFAQIVAKSEAPQDLEPLTHGGPTHWTEKIHTQGIKGGNDGAYAIDTITHPVENPYRSWMRFSGFDFFEDDSKAAIATWSGDIWLVEGIDDSMKNMTWQRIASGMFQPLGIKIVDGDIYAICRDQITILRDLNGDGETDFYENFNNDHQVTEHFHEFALDLKQGIDGDFYYTKGGRHGADSITPNHGTLIRVSKDGTESEFVANGFRAPNGLGLGPNGEMLIADNQGHWIPANRINWIKPGGFYGYMWGYHEGQNISRYDEPLCWIHPSVDRSPGTFAWVPDYRWGPLKDHIISASYGMGQIYHVLHEEIEGVRQGGVVKFPLDFKTGVTRAAFRKSDGQLYLAGLFGWAGNKTQPGGFYRVRYTGKSLYMPEDLHIASDGVVLTFTDPLDPDSAVDPGNYAIEHWNYKWTENYGSPDFKMDGTRGRDTLNASQVSLSADRRTVYIEIPGIRKVMQMDIRLNILAADKTPITHQVHHTIHKLGPKAVLELAGQGIIKGRRAEVESEETEQGLLQSFVMRGETDKQDLRKSRVVALYAKSDTPPTPFLEAGKYVANWGGSIHSDLNQSYTFSVEGNGESYLRIDAKEVPFNTPFPLKQGPNKFQIAYVPPESGDAEFRLSWESEDLNREPIPATAFTLKNGQSFRDGRERKRNARLLVAEHKCLSCHQPGAELTDAAMPELHEKAPALDNIAQRLTPGWLEKWILDPGSIRPDTKMPTLLHDPDSELTRSQAGDIVAYLTSIATKPKNQVLPKTPTRELNTRGRKLANELGCIACHTLESTSEIPGQIPLGDLIPKYRGAALINYLLQPEASHPDTKMPNFALTKEEAQAIGGFLMAKSETRGAMPWKLDGNVKKGEALVASKGCLNCHDIQGATSTLQAPTLSAIRQSTLKRGCLADTEGQRGDAPQFAFTIKERADISEFIKNYLDSLYRFSPEEYAERQIERLNCLACHSRDGLGDRWAELAPMSTSENDEGATIHTGRPPLDFAGEKLQSDWVTRLLSGELDTKTRPGLTARMPAFKSRAENIAIGLAAQHGYSGDNPVETDRDAKLAALGRDLALSEDKFRCNACHGMGDALPLAGADTETINFAEIPERLRRSFFHRLTLDPQSILPGTQMPQYVDDDGASTIANVLDGDIDQQFDALWHFMRSLKNN